MQVKTLNEKSFSATVKSIAKQGEKLAADIHAAGCYAIAQSYTGNPNPAVKLIDALHKSQRAEAVKSWLSHFGALKWDGVKKSMAHRARKDISPDKIDGMIAEAQSTPYWDLTKEAAVSDGVYDVLAHINAVLAMANKIAEGKSKKFHTLKNADGMKKVAKALGNAAANDVATESNDINAIAIAMAKRNDALDLFKAMADALNFDIDFKTEELEAA